MLVRQASLHTLWSQTISTLPSTIHSKPPSSRLALPPATPTGPSFFVATARFSSTLTILSSLLPTSPSSLTSRANSPLSRRLKISAKSATSSALSSTVTFGSALSSYLKRHTSTISSPPTALPNAEESKRQWKLSTTSHLRRVKLVIYIKSEYQQTVGHEMYACVLTRPNIAYTMSVLSRFLTNPNDSHLAAAKRVLKYLSPLRRTESLSLSPHPLAILSTSSSSVT